MGRNSGAIRYAGGVATSSVGLTNMYIYGGSILSLITFILGLASAGTVGAAINTVIDFYIMRLVPWPLDELLLASTLLELAFSHALTIGVGLSAATSKWWFKVDI